MAGIYIPRMQMPEFGSTFNIKIYWTGEVVMETPAGWQIVATVIPVLDHGNLIDKDTVIARAWDMETFFDAVKNAPTIIPAEEEDE